MTTVINPIGMEAVEWCDRTAGLFANLIPPMKIETEAEWRRWAVHARFFQPQVPDEGQFKRWNEWADRFNQVLGV